MDAAELFENGIVEYQPPAPLDPETGSPEVSYNNVKRLLAAGWEISSIRTRPTGVLFTLVKRGLVETYYAPGLHVGCRDVATELVARLAAEAGYGRFEDLLDKYQCCINQDRPFQLEHEDVDEPGLDPLGPTG
jgi:hypothetical protein